MVAMINRLIGAVLKKDVFNEYGTLLLPAGVKLNRHDLELLMQLGYSLDDMDLIVPLEPTPSTNERTVTQAALECRRVFESIKTDGEIPIGEVNQLLIPSVYEAAEFPSLYSVLSGLQAKDDYTYRHNIGVGVISNLIGKWLKLEHEDLSLLTTAATLHDVGKINIDDDILNKPGKYTDEEYAVMKRHTTYGYDIIKSSRHMSERVALVALQHHERDDCLGYPYGIAGDRMDYFSKIVAVADVFHAMTSKRVYKNASPFYQVLEQMKLDGFGKLDTAICALFVRRIMEMSVGGEVDLTDGRRVRIVMLNDREPELPLVEWDGRYIDLSKERNAKLSRLVS